MKKENRSTLQGNNLVFVILSCSKGAETRGGRQGAARPGKHIQVCAGKEYMQSVEIFSQPSVNCLSETEDILHDPVGVFHFAAYSGFAVLHIPLPVNGVV